MARAPGAILLTALIRLGDVLVVLDAEIGKVSLVAAADVGDDELDFEDEDMNSCILARKFCLQVRPTTHIHCT